MHLNDFDLVTLESNGEHSSVAVVKWWMWLHKYQNNMNLSVNRLVLCPLYYFGQWSHF